MLTRTLTLLTCYLAVSALSAQNPPSLGTPGTDTLLLGSGDNFLLVPAVDDGEAGTDQPLTFEVTSSDPAVLQADSVSHQAGQTFARVHVSEKGVLGTATLRVVASDADGSDTVEFDAFVGPYDNPGINFEIHDIVFWQRVTPLEANPAFSMIATSGEAPYAEINLEELQLSVYSDCKDSPPCTGTDFFTALFKGYLIPPASGDYTFYMRAGDQCNLGISTDESFDRASQIIYSPSDGRIGTSSGNKEWKSAPVSLEAGKTYAIYGTQWNIHTPIGGMLWEGPGISKEYIPGGNMSYVYDVEKPTVPTGFEIITTGTDDLIAGWNAASDNRNLAGYNLYVNGLKTNDTLIRETRYLLDGLSSGTRYCMLVTAVDRAGNESPASEVLCTETYTSDDTPPLPPDTVMAGTVSDLFLSLRWSGASDGETEIRGYNLYVDGVLYNPGTLIYKEEVLLSGLTPETAYSIEIEAVDAGWNVSLRSTPQVFTTRPFDPLDDAISNKKARLTVSMEPIGRSNGLGVNPNYKNSGLLSDTEVIGLLRDLEVAAVRWGALTANPLSFGDYIGTGKEITIGGFMDLCNSLNAYTVFTCGVEDGTDWRTDPQTFVRFLEYLAGPADSEYGAIRAQEGFTEPLLDASRGLVFEFGNEVWGGTSHEAQIGGDYGEYGAWCREMSRLMKESEYYDPDKVILAYSGRNPVPTDSYGLHDALLEGDQGEVDWLALSGYLGGNLTYSPEIDPGESELDYYKNGIVEMARNLSGFRQTTDLGLRITGDLKPSYMYEANMTTSSYFGRLGQALVQTDYYASAAENGGAIPTVFNLTGGQWKMVIPGQDYKKLPLYHTTRFYNRFCKGNALRVQMETNAAIPGASLHDYYLDPVGCHVYSEGEAFSVLLISRDYENDFTVQVDLPDELKLIAPETGMKYVISGPGYSSTETTIDSVQVTMSDSLLVKVPKHSMVILAFGTEDPEMDKLPMGYFDYVSATAVAISAYGSDVFDIDGNEKRILLAEVEPEEVLSDAVIWSVDTMGTEVVAQRRSFGSISGFEVRGSGTCAGNGTVTVRASAWDNPEIYDEVQITITGQGSDCNTAAADRTAEALVLYPNPAAGQLYLEGIPSHARMLEVTDLSGRSCMKQPLTGRTAALDLSQLDPGIYLLKITGERSPVIRSFVRR